MGAVNGNLEVKGRVVTTFRCVASIIWKGAQNKDQCRALRTSTIFYAVTQFNHRDQATH